MLTVQVVTTPHAYVGAVLSNGRSVATTVTPTVDRNRAAHDALRLQQAVHAGWTNAQGESLAPSHLPAWACTAAQALTANETY